MQLIPISSIRQWQIESGVRSPLSISAVCPHCAEQVTFSLGSRWSDAPRRAVAATSRCPACIELVQFWAVRREQTPKDGDDNPAAVYMYPPATNYYACPELASDIPEALQRAFVATVNAFNSHNYTATAVCGRRTLEGIFKYRVPADKRSATLANLIDIVSSDAALAEPLTALSHAIRSGGNIGAHFDPDREPNEVIARQMVELIDYLISYLYVLPNKIGELEKSLGKEP